MKCLYCKNGKMEIVWYKKPKVGHRLMKDKALLQCNACGHKEVFE